jgi:hypothetical protein
MYRRIALIMGPGFSESSVLSILAGCGGSTASTVNSPPSSGSTPIPAIATISPNSAAAGGSAFTLTITGANFVAASVVAFGGTSVTTTFVSSTQLTAAIPGGAIAAAGSPAVTVTNPAPVGGTSNALSFTIGSGTNPIPTISSLSPSCGPARQQSLNPFAKGQLYVVGQKFVYVTNAGSNSVWVYNIDASTGTLTLIGTIGTWRGAGSSGRALFDVFHFGGPHNLIPTQKAVSRRKPVGKRL